MVPASCFVRPLSHGATVSLDSWVVLRRSVGDSFLDSYARSTSKGVVKQIT